MLLKSDLQAVDISASCIDRLCQQVGIVVSCQSWICRRKRLGAYDRIAQALVEEPPLEQPRAWQGALVEDVEVIRVFGLQTWIALTHSSPRRPTAGYLLVRNQVREVRTRESTAIHKPDSRTGRNAVAYRCTRQYIQVRTRNNIRHGSNGVCIPCAQIALVVFARVLKPHAKHDPCLPQVRRVHQISGGYFLNLVEGITHRIVDAAIALCAECTDFVIFNGRSELVVTPVVIRILKIPQEVRHRRRSIFKRLYVSTHDRVNVGIVVPRVLVFKLVFIAESASKLKGAGMSGKRIRRYQRSTKAKIDLRAIQVLNRLARIEVLCRIKDIDAILNIQMRQ